MGSLNTTIGVSVPIDRVYRYLNGRFEGDGYRAACEATLGYVPGVKCIEAVENKRLRYAVAGRDALHGFRGPGWSWSYDLSSESDGKTHVTIGTSGVSSRPSSASGQLGVKHRKPLSIPSWPWKHWRSMAPNIYMACGVKRAYGS